MTTRQRRTWSARARIVGSIALLLCVLLSSVVGVTARVLFFRADQAAAEEAAHEVAKFRHATASGGTHPGAEATSVRELLTSYLSDNVTDSSEQLFSVVDGKADRRSRSESSVSRLDTDPAFVARAAEATQPVSGRVDTPSGPAEFAVVPVSLEGSPDRGALVIVENLGPDYREARTTVLVMALSGLAALAVTGLCGWIVAGRVLAPIRRVRETAESITESDLSLRIEVTGKDDVAQLATTFNRMLDRLETSFDGQRQFLDDAGHELRTPVTIVRGHLSVMGEEPEERRQTLALVNDELKRMSRLIDDLIMLARSERPGFVDLAPTSLADLLVETLAKATPLGARAWSIDALPEREALVDGHRLTQALLQLASNAVSYSAEGDRIRIGGAVEADRLLLWVSDSGIGIASEDQAGIFERFTRGPRTSHTPGRGLGLAIVTRIAEAHGGTVSVDSTPGVGSTFTLDLPYREPREIPCTAS